MPLSLATVDTSGTPLSLQYCSGGATPPPAALAAVRFGSAVSPASALEIATPVLGQAADALELWHTDQPVRTGTQGLLHYAMTDDVLFGAICIPDTDSDVGQYPGGGYDPLRPSLLQQASEQVYLAVFSALESLGYLHPLRVWNYFSAINTETWGMERYLQFNIGRQDAFRTMARPFLANAPAACALGTHGGGLNVYFLAAKVPPLAIENPRQVSAYFYPDQYGPRTPSFSRAALAALPGQRWLFLSGTASIVGHQTLHAGDVRAQTEETLRNIAALLAQANRAEGSQGKEGWTLAAVQYKVYVRHTADFEAVRAVIDVHLPPAAVRIYLQADVCRDDLLMEIEATGCLPAPGV
ncbi:Rid family hydrolase [Rhodoferax sp.]|uniref:chorismate transformation enzyme, FkbO/Hyg5 family n=1 Tax=Rhodoferax sp. TaxID=50421 RepID=UPI0025E9DB14|nr:Rid family hydrolase [Rhodoferax sp.]